METFYLTFSLTQHETVTNVLDHSMNFILSLYKMSLFIQNLLGREIFADIMNALVKNYVKHIKEYT
jgi:hypothetical protein